MSLLCYYFLLLLLITLWRFVVEFKLPTAENREVLWKKLLPPFAPLASDVDFKSLGAKFNVLSFLFLFSFSFSFSFLFTLSFFWGLIMFLVLWGEYQECMLQGLCSSSLENQRRRAEDHNEWLIGCCWGGVWQSSPRNCSFCINWNNVLLLLYILHQ